MNDVNVAASSGASKLNVESHPVEPLDWFCVQVGLYCAATHDGADHPKALWCFENSRLRDIHDHFETIRREVLGEKPSCTASP